MQLTVKETTINKTSVITIPAASNIKEFKHTFYNIKLSGHYNITVATDFQGAIPSQSIVYNAPPIPSPYQLNAVYQGEDYSIYWVARQLPEPMLTKVTYHYELLINEGISHIDEKTAQKIEVDQPPFLFKPKLDTIYAFAVRLVTNEGFKSTLSETIGVTQPQGEYFCSRIK